MQIAATPIQRRMILAREAPDSRISLAEPIASGRLETKIASSPDPHSLSRCQPDPQHQLLGDPIEKSAKRQRGSRVGAAAATGAATAGGKARGDQPVETEVGEGTDPEADRGGPEAANPNASAASSKLTALISAPAPKARTKPTCLSGQRR